MEFHAKNFEELTASELYEILKARAEIFVMEQQILYQDMDDTDYRSLHCFLTEGNRVRAYLRAYFDDVQNGVPSLAGDMQNNAPSVSGNVQNGTSSLSGDTRCVKIGRVLSLQHGKGWGGDLLAKSLPVIREKMNPQKICMDAQTHAIKFYEKYGFRVTSGEFLEEGIVHVKMELSDTNPCSSTTHFPDDSVRTSTTQKDDNHLQTAAQIADHISSTPKIATSAISASGCTDLPLSALAMKLREFDEYRIVYHIRPDGDCIGSSYALALALQSIGKKCEVVGRDPVPRVHRYMTDQFRPDILTNPTYIAVDSADPERVGTYADCHFTFCIDHHNNTFDCADYRYVATDCGACSEIILQLIKTMGIPVTKEMADLLYTALVTDTMCFRTSDTSVQSLETAAELARLGADTYKISNLNMFIKSKGRLQVENIISSNFHYTCNDQILTTMLTLDDLDAAGVLDSDLEGINSIVAQVEGVKIGVTIRELPDKTARCSTRTNGDISANEICRIHGGGGHFHAACCILNTDMQSARAIMEETCRKYLKEHI